MVSEKIDKKNNCEHYGQKVKKHVFFKTFFGFSFLDIFKMSNFRFPFYFLGTLFFIFQKYG
jgi:hypothetical protein